MSAVVTFWWLPDEEDAFLSYLGATGTVLALPSRWVKTRQELAPRPIASYIQQHDPDQVLFGLDRHALAAEIESPENERGQWLAVAYMSPCLIAYTRAKWRGLAKLGQANLCAYWSYPGPDGVTMRDKAPAFVRWTKSVFRWVRRATPQWHQHRGYRASRRVKQALLAGELEAVP